MLLVNAKTVYLLVARNQFIYRTFKSKNNNNRKIVFFLKYFFHLKVRFKMQSRNFHFSALQFRKWIKNISRRRRFPKLFRVLPIFHVSVSFKLKNRDNEKLFYISVGKLCQIKKGKLLVYFTC